MSGSYFYLQPGVFSVVGFTYGKAEGSATRSGKIKVKLVQSGRWETNPDESADLTLAEIEPRVVTPQEALDGVGTLIGSAICTSRVPLGGARVWDYGLVVGYKWDSGNHRGMMDVNFDGVVIPVLHEPESIQDVAVEIYALRPCGGRSMSLVMPLELKQKHEQVYNKFNGVGQSAIRDSKVLLTEVGGKPVDESKSLSLLDITSCDISQVTIRHILDYVYYQDGQRTPPPDIRLGTTIFDLPSESVSDEQPRRHTTHNGHPGNGDVRDDGLSDSDDDNEPQGSGRLPQQTINHSVHRTSTNLGSAQPDKSESTAVERLHNLKTRCAGDLQLQADIDNLISLRRGGLAPDAAAQGIPRQSAENTDKNQFQPTGTQTAIFQTLVDGAYVSMKAQRFVEFVQIHWRKFGFFPHPAVLRGLFGWDFGTRGLSILHFIRVTEQQKREAVLKNDMSNFSRNNVLPRPMAATDFSVVIGAVEILYNLARQVYRPVVQDILQAAVTFLAELRVSDAPTSESALTEITAWIDDRLDMFRVYVSDKDLEQAATLKSHFSVSHESFVRVNQLILRHELQSVRKRDIEGVHPPRNSQAVAKRASKYDRRSSRSIPVEIRRALPKQGGKELCLRYLSEEGCRGENGNCVESSRCHFKPAALPQNVREFIDKKFGGVAKDMQ